MKQKKTLITGITGQDGSYLEDDTVIGTVQNHTVREFVQIVFEELELNYEDQLFFYPRFYCPTEVEILVANSAKANEN